MATIHDIREQKITDLIYQYASFIRSHDASYERELQQISRILEGVANLTRYANAVQERINNV